MHTSLSENIQQHQTTLSLIFSFSLAMNGFMREDSCAFMTTPISLSQFMSLGIFPRVYFIFSQAESSLHWARCPCLHTNLGSPSMFLAAPATFYLELFCRCCCCLCSPCALSLPCFCQGSQVSGWRNPERAPPMSSYTWKLADFSRQNCTRWIKDGERASWGGVTACANPQMCDPEWWMGRPRLREAAPGMQCSRPAKGPSSCQAGEESC